MYNTSTNQGLNDQQARVGLCSIPPKPEAYGSSTIQLCSQSCCKLAPSFSLGGCEERWGNNLGLYVVKKCFRNTSIGQFFFNRLYLSNAQAVLILAQRPRAHWSSNSRLPFYRARNLPCAIRSGKQKNTWMQVGTCAVSLQSPCPDKGVLVHCCNQEASEKSGRKEQLYFLTLECQTHVILAFKSSIFLLGIFPVELDVSSKTVNDKIIQKCGQQLNVCITFISLSKCFGVQPSWRYNNKSAC